MIPWQSSRTDDYSIYVTWNLEISSAHSYHGQGRGNLVTFQCEDP